MCEKIVKFSDVLVHKYFELNGQVLIKITLFEMLNNGKKQNAVFLYGENTGTYTFVDDDTEVTIRRAE